jgi:hypothetical protein
MGKSTESNWRGDVIGFDVMPALVDDGGDSYDLAVPSASWLLFVLPDGGRTATPLDAAAGAPGE